VQILGAKATDIVSELRHILEKKYIQLKQYRWIMGKLRHVALILPGIKGLFSPINKVLQCKPRVIGMGRNSNVKSSVSPPGTYG
jgi:hypothetical protein